jgi:hypothetical protein
MRAGARAQPGIAHGNYGMWVAGQRFIPMHGGTVTLSHCGIDPDRAWGWITYIADGSVSFHLEAGRLWVDPIEGVCKTRVFTMNFRPDPLWPLRDVRCIMTQHFKRKFPEDFFVG